MLRISTIKAFLIFLLFFLSGLSAGSLFAANRDFIRLSPEQNFVLLDRFERSQPENTTRQFLGRPLEIIDDHHLLGDGFTRVVQVRWLGTDYFLQGLEMFKTLRGEAPGDTVVLTTAINGLETGSRWIRVFTSSRDWYLQTADTENNGLWVRPLSPTDYEKWKKPKMQTSAHDEWKDWLQLEVQSTNENIKTIFEALSRASGLEKPVPFYTMVSLENRALLVWHSEYSAEQFAGSQAIFLQHIRQLLPESNFSITAGSGQIEIRRLW